MTSAVPVQAIDLGEVTHQGRVRSRNEDAYSHDQLFDAQGQFIGWIFVVADGVGGEHHGGVASQMAVQRTLEIYKAQSLQNPFMPVLDVMRETITLLNAEIYEKAADLNVAGHMGTTLVMAVLRPNRVLHVAWVGDSRLYVVSRRMEKVRQVSRDHTEAYDLVRQKVITPEQAQTHPRRNVLSRSVGGQPETTPEFAEGMLEFSDTIVICTDGLTRHVTADHIKTLALQPVSSNQIAQQLAATANQMGGKDNITALVIYVGQRESQMDTDLPLFDGPEPQYSIMDSSAYRPSLSTPSPFVKKKSKTRRRVLLAAGIILVLVLVVMGGGLIFMSQQPPVTITEVGTIESAAFSTDEVTSGPQIVSTMTQSDLISTTPTSRPLPTRTPTRLKTQSVTSNPSPTRTLSVIATTPQRVVTLTPDDAVILVATDTPAPLETPTIPILIGPLSEPYPNGTCLVTVREAPVYAAVGGAAAYTLPENIVVFMGREGQRSYSQPTANGAEIYYSVKPNDGSAGIGWIRSEDLSPVQGLTPEQQAAIFSPHVLNDNAQVAAASWRLAQAVVVRANLLGCVPMRLTPDLPDSLYIVENTAQATIADGLSVVVNGNLWWNVRLTDGRTGWIQQTYLARAP